MYKNKYRSTALVKRIAFVMSQNSIAKTDGEMKHLAMKNEILLLLFLIADLSLLFHLGFVFQQVQEMTALYLSSPPLQWQNTMYK